ncbi:hypothetical protein BSIN_3618 [Burkholderia singularis]|uniref:Uncharacterized protein n=1 Tax=Burkholderia singularis TaxID=1503053 RepID=A0A238H5A7_9BURK|nr:hypothetical protein BSIN_3618 [Burkholderia singularis]
MWLLPTSLLFELRAARHVSRLIFECGVACLWARVFMQSRHNRRLLRLYFHTECDL